MSYLITINRQFVQNFRRLTKVGEKRCFAKNVEAPKKVEVPNEEIQKFRMFSPKNIKKHYEIIPLLAILGGALIGMIGYFSYFVRTRDDVMYSRSSRPNFETLDLLNPPKRKLFTINQKYKAMSELNEAYEGMRDGDSNENNNNNNKK